MDGKAALYEAVTKHVSIQEVTYQPLDSYCKGHSFHKCINQYKRNLPIQSFGSIWKWQLARMLIWFHSKRSPRCDKGQINPNFEKGNSFHQLFLPSAILIINYSCHQHKAESHECNSTTNTSCDDWDYALVLPSLCRSSLVDGPYIREQLRSG